MTQRTLKTAIGNRDVTVQMGWDRPLQYLYMVIDYVDSEDDEPLYSNLSVDEAGLRGKLAYFTKKTRPFGIEVPSTMLARIQSDEALNLANGTSTFDTAGVDTQE
ncbi:MULTISPECIES: hypothetical protein [Paraburkholderia]|uniref:hypothetical protein n=1 Tax=Paraburkholderia TaxID=1822464 RepID=UPI002259951F|nr:MULTISPECIES: hypothetical protein [Paraburkholderia]MCX4175663.1 hypothetical protein [Paraburkholderia madseniana]MDQ6463658.1 hypothetical protein [Paraburkholderia madseniana]